MRNSTANVTVTVLDVNDNRPVFGQSEYSATVTEDVVVGTTVTVLALTATDADSGTNGQLSHSITRGNDQGTFRLDSARGTLATATTLDHETTASYNLTVQAIDRGSPALSSSVNVTITVGDVNDNSPVFEQSIYTATLPSDAQKEWSFTVTATDRDSGSNAAITYSIIERDVAEIFSIDAESGEIHVTCMIDTEKFPSFTLTVQATDGGTPTRLSGQATVMITVDTGTTTSTTATLIFIGDIGGTTTATSCGSAASLHNVKLFLYPLLPLLMLLVSAALGI